MAMFTTNTRNYANNSQQSQITPQLVDKLSNKGSLETLKDTQAPFVNFSPSFLLPSSAPQSWAEIALLQCGIATHRPPPPRRNSRFSHKHKQLCSSNRSKRLLHWNYFTSGFKNSSIFLTPDFVLFYFILFYFITFYISYF